MILNMKKLFLTLTATLVCAGAFSQGALLFGVNSDNLIYFTTDTAHLDPADVGKTFDSPADGGPFTIAGSSAFVGPCLDGTSIGSIQALAGQPTFVAALYAGTSSTSLSLQTTTTIDSWTNNPGGIVVVAALMAAPFQVAVPAFFQVQIFDSRADTNAVGGGAADAWVHPNMYAGASPIFQATPLPVPDYIYRTAPPVSSTWPPGTFNLVDLTIICGGPDCGYGGIALYANPGPPPPRPQITSQPANATNYWGQSVTFTVLATGDQPLHYQWQANGTDLVDGPTTFGSATNQLALSALTLTDAGGYRVIITNYAGSVTSRAAILALVGAPSITQQPVSQIGYWGKSATFTVTATGYPAPSYQWQKEDAPVLGATGASLVLTNLQVTNAGRYTVVVTNLLGSTTSSVAILTLGGAPGITRQPVSQVGYLGKSIAFTVTATGDPPPSYQWQKDGAPIAGATNTSLVLTNLQWTNAGRYTVVVSNPVKTVTSSNAYLTIGPADVTIALYSGITIEGTAGQTYGIQCSTNLDDTNGWWGLTNLTLEAPGGLWLDVQPAAQQQRYYLVVPGPISIP